MTDHIARDTVDVCDAANDLSEVCAESKGVALRWLG